MAKTFRAGFKAVLEGKSSALLFNIAIGIALVAALLFLPPVSAYARVAPSGFSSIGSGGGGMVDADGTQVTLSAPAGDIEAKFSSLPRLDFINGKVSPGYAAASSSLPGHLTMKSPLYHLSVRQGELPTDPGSGVDLVTLTVPVPNDAEPVSALALYEWTGSTWRFVPSHVVAEDDVLEAVLDYVPGPIAAFHQEPVVPEVVADVQSGSDVAAMAAAVTELDPLGYYLLGDGSIAGELPTEMGQVSGARIAPVIANWGTDGVVRSDWTDNIVALPDLRAAHVQELTALVSRNDFAGIDLDYRDLNPALRDEFTAFVADLADSLHATGKTLGVRVPEPVQVADDRWDTGAYDWRALGRYVDRLVVPTLPELDAYADNGKLATMLQWAAGEVERYRVFVSMPALSREQVQQWVLYRPYEALLQSFGNIEVEQGGEIAPSEKLQVRLSGLNEWSGVQYDEGIHTHWFSYKDGGGIQHIVQLEDPRSLAYKLALIGNQRVRGVVITGIGQHPGTWDVLADYRDLVISEPDSPVTLALSLTNSGGKGEQSEMQAGTVAWDLTAPNATGRYTLAAAMSVGSYEAVAAQGLALQVVEPTATPTVAPTAVPTDTPEPTATPEEIVEEPTATPEPATESEASETEAAPEPTATSAPRVVAAPPPSGGGGFGYGVQAHMLANGQAGQSMAMTAGMGFNWIKQQIEWKLFEPNKGDYQWGMVDEVVNAANAAGINVMLSVVKAPRWARPASADFGVEGPPANPQDYADFIGAMAAHYRGRVGAYEIWNEQNLHYEWGNEPIDPNRYMELLKLAYAAVKANDPGALVISGALTPTGAPAPWAMDDFAYLEGMYQAGLKNYCDGIGAHPSGFNMPPDADWSTFNDPTAAFRGPSDNHHHSWSFRATMEGYRNIAVTYGDSGKRIWATEFGWASSPVPVANYEYASDNTQQEQAEWTVRAYQMGKNWGWVGPMFLWNLNFNVVAPGSEQAQWGIVDSGWGPLPIYSALAGMPK